MKAQKVYDLLKLVRKNYPQYEEKSFRLLKYIYNDVYKDFIEGKIIATLKEGLSYSDERICDGLKDGFIEFLDGEDGSILDYFSEMMLSGDKKFIDNFFSLLSDYFVLIDNKFYNENDFYPATLTFNIYIILKLYHVYKNDFDTYNKYVSDFLFLIDKGDMNLDYFSSDDFSLEKKKKFIDNLIDMKMFDDFPILKDKLISFLKDVSVCWNDEKIDGYVEILPIIIDIYEFVTNNFDKNISVDNVNFVIDELFKKCDDCDHYVFYSPILLIGERFSYMQDSYEKYIDHVEFMNEIVENIKDLDNGLFDYLDEISGNGKDSFIVCMDIVFDSDTFYEVNSKLKSLKRASVLYGESDREKKEALDEVNALSSLKHKKEIKSFNNKKVMYNHNAINFVEKPEKISERMEELYFDILNIFSDDYRSYFNSFFNAYDMLEFEEDIDELISDISVSQDEKSYEGLDDDGVMNLLSEENLLSSAGKKSDTSSSFIKLKSIFGKKN